MANFIRDIRADLHVKKLPFVIAETGMSGNQSSLPLAGSPFKFKQHGKSGAWMSDLLPHTANNPEG